MKADSPDKTWLRIAAEARAQMAAASPDEPAPVWFVARVLERRRRAQAASRAPLLAIPFLGRAAAASVALAAACAVFAVSTGSFDDLEGPLFPEPIELPLP